MKKLKVTSVTDLLNTAAFPTCQVFIVLIFSGEFFRSRATLYSILQSSWYKFGDHYKHQSIKTVKLIATIVAQENEL